MLAQRKCFLNQLVQYWSQGASLGLASGITGGAAAITKKVLNSQQMKRVEVAIEVIFSFQFWLDLHPLEWFTGRLRCDQRTRYWGGSSQERQPSQKGRFLLETPTISVLPKGCWGGFHSGWASLWGEGFDGRGEGSNARAGLILFRKERFKNFTFTLQTIIAGLEAVGSIFGENVNKEIAKLVAQVHIGFYHIWLQCDFGCIRVRERFCPGLLPQFLEGSPCCGICTRLPGQSKPSHREQIIFLLCKTLHITAERGGEEAGRRRRGGCPRNQVSPVTIG